MATQGRRMISRAHTESVTMGRIATVTVSPATASKTNGQTQQYTVACTDENGNVVPHSASDITWTRSSTSMGTLSGAGLLTAGATPGTYQVRATHANAVYGEADAVIS